MESKKYFSWPLVHVRRGSIQTKNHIVHDRFRNVLMFIAPNWLADVAKERKPLEMAKKKEQIDAKQKESYELVKPVTRKFTITAK